MRSTALIGMIAASLALTGASADTPKGDVSTIAGLGTQKTVLGDAFADAHGMTLYVFDGDTAPGKAACTGACADTWAPFTAPGIAKPVGDWSIVDRADGFRQWAWHGKPLYEFSGDHAAGDVSGDGVDGRWHAALKAHAFLPSQVAIRTTDYGPTFVTADGRTLYMLVKFFYNAGTNGTLRHQTSPAPSACTQDCAQSWTPLIVPSGAKPEGDWTSVARDDGSQQWAWKGHPLYTYTRDGKPGDALGEGNWTLIGNIGTHWEVANITP